MRKHELVPVSPTNRSTLLRNLPARIFRQRQQGLKISESSFWKATVWAYPFHHTKTDKKMRKMLRVNSPSPTSVRISAATAFWSLPRSRHIQTAAPVALP
ncbi:hypothetical protein M3J09_003151 [Ascochyta lentis]